MVKKNNKNYSFILTGILILVIAFFLFEEKVINGNGTSSVIGEKNLGLISVLNNMKGASSNQVNYYCTNLKS